VRVGNHEHASRRERGEECLAIAGHPEDDEVGDRAAGVETSGHRLGDPAGRLDPVELREALGQAPGVVVVVGERAFIARARRARKLLGGGMRQVGVVAAAGLVALSDGPDGTIARLAEDHANARRLAEGLAELEGIESPGGIAQPAPGRLDPGRAVTNFVVFRVARDREAFLAALAARDVLMVPYPHGTIRAVTHYGIDAADVDRTIIAVRDALAETAATRPAGGDSAATGAWTRGAADPAPAGA
jgi:hypothetical protein